MCCGHSGNRASTKITFWTFFLILFKEQIFWKIVTVIRSYVFKKHCNARWWIFTKRASLPFPILAVWRSPQPSSSVDMICIKQSAQYFIWNSLFSAMIHTPWVLKAYVPPAPARHARSKWHSAARHAANAMYVPVFSPAHGKCHWAMPRCQQEKCAAVPVQPFVFVLHLYTVPVRYAYVRAWRRRPRAICKNNVRHARPATFNVTKMPLVNARKYPCKSLRKRMLILIVVIVVVFI